MQMVILLSLMVLIPIQGIWAMGSVEPAASKAPQSALNQEIADDEEDVVILDDDEDLDEDDDEDETG